MEQVAEEKLEKAADRVERAADRLEDAAEVLEKSATDSAAYEQLAGDEVIPPTASA